MTTVLKTLLLVFAALAELAVKMEYLIYIYTLGGTFYIKMHLTIVCKYTRVYYTG